MRLLLGLLTVVACLAGEHARLAPLTGPPPHPADNPGTPDKIKLGELLFFERQLSGERRRSCGTCHKTELLFMDGLTRAWALNESELRRKTPTLLNVGWHKRFFFDGRAPSLEEQASAPLENQLEMDLDPQVAVERLREDPYYQRWFAAVFPGEELRWELVAKAISAFERTLVSYDSDFDRYLLGDTEAMSADATAGLTIFEGKGDCVRCHNGPLLSDQEFHYIGVPEIEGDNPPGTKYKTQSLRDVMRKYSYMHNGHYLTMRDVLDHYATGGETSADAASELRPIDLGEDERRQLIAFLRALDGRVFRLTEAIATDRGPFSQMPGRKRRPEPGGPYNAPR